MIAEFWWFLFANIVTTVAVMGALAVGLGIFILVIYVISKLTE